MFRLDHCHDGRGGESSFKKKTSTSPLEENSKSNSSSSSLSSSSSSLHLLQVHRDSNNHQNTNNTNNNNKNIKMTTAGHHPNHGNNNNIQQQEHHHYHHHQQQQPNTTNASHSRKRKESVSSVHESVMEIALPMATSADNNINHNGNSSMTTTMAATTTTTNEEGKKKRKNATFYQQLHKPQASGEFAPMSCQHCRSLHKRCDRSLPNCSRCVQTNHICLYPELTNKKKKKTTHNNQNNNNTNPVEKASSTSFSHEKTNPLSSSQMSSPPTIAGVTISSSSPQMSSPQPAMQSSFSPGSTTNFSSTNNILENAISSPLSLSAISSKLASLDSTTQLKLFDMAANALSRNPGQLNSLIANIPPGLISAFTGKFQSTNSAEVTPIVSIPTPTGQVQHAVKPITAFVLDIYFHTYSFGFPLIPKERMTALLDLVLLKQQQQLAPTAELQQSFGIQIKNFYDRVAKQHWSSATDMEKDLAVFFAVLAATLQCSGNFVYQQYRNCANNLDLIHSAGASINLHQTSQQFESPLEASMGSGASSMDSIHDDLFIQDLKNKWFNNSKTIIGKYFDDMDGMSIPIALTFLVYYLVGEGDLQRARMYTSMVESLCQKVWGTMHCFGIGSRGFVNGAKPVVSQLSKISGTNSFVSNIMYGLPALLVHRYLRPIEMFLAEFEEPTNSLVRKLQHIGNKIRIDLTFIQDWEHIQDDEMEELDRLIKFLSKYIDLLFSTMMNKDSILYITSYLNFLDVVLDVYERAVTKRTESMLKFAADIIEITKLPLFVFLPTPFISTIIKGVRVRLKYGKPTESFHSSINLREDMSALKTLTSKYPIVNKLYGEVIREVETFLYLQSFSHATLVQPINISNNNTFSTNTTTTTSSNNNNNGNGSSNHHASATLSTNDFDFEDDSGFDIMNFLNNEAPLSSTTFNFDDELFGELFSMPNLDNISTTSNDSCESIFIDGEKLEIPSCVKPGSFLPILIKNLSKQKDILQQGHDRNSEPIKKLRSELIEELTQHAGTDENTKLLIQLFTKQYLHA
ncbi:hypothetical protein FDP41_000345 [Naegleria fowleri]|uniref:Zn(2)-C6 fungal-type domain-containing protein n=1 Tax=Naegleria fowleri TaxID=5763 RepID=A0A6A5C9N0_NAEFO|nr:uncharacterized protein FDP41_000345 [Naegleria fowleri]KAF0984446.1 hypothetical protein FDP41_000345 [Naegleria fowleri]